MTTGAFRDEHTDDLPAPRYGLYIGVVEDDADPEKRGRVKVMVPTVTEPGRWARCLTLGAGPRRGAFAPPPTGSVVGVMYEQGDDEEPVCMGGLPLTGVQGLGNASPVYTPFTTAQNERTYADPADVPDIIDLFQTNEWIVRIVNLADAPTRDAQGNQLARPRSILQILHRDKRVAFEMDGVDGSVTVRAQTALNLQSDGIVSIEGARIQLNDRVVMPGERPI